MGCIGSRCQHSLHRWPIPQLRAQPSQPLQRLQLQQHSRPRHPQLLKVLVVQHPQLGL